MEIIRLAVIRVGKTPDEVPGVSARIGAVDITPIRPVTVEGKPVGRLYAARTPITESPADFVAGWSFPRDAVWALQNGLEMVARMLGVDRYEDHSLSSPYPCVGLLGEADQLADLDGRTISEHTSQVKLMGTGHHSLLTGSSEPVEDRPDGLALLAGALNSASALGQFFHLYRLFERAFKRTSTDLREPLKKFASGSPLDFEEEEVDRWLDARGMSAHADRRENFFLDGDIRPFIQRMLLAGYEVLFNKLTWRDPSSARREIWRPTVGSLGTGTDLFLDPAEGQGVSLAARVYDGFDAYPVILAGFPDSILPAAAWLRESGRLTVGGGMSIHEITE